MKTDITIAAISTSYGRSAIGVIRVSGQNVTKIIETFIGKTLAPRRAVNTTIKDELGNVLDDVIAIYYKSPNSYTGEDMLEIQCHGNPVILDNILSVICTKYASHSEPGQFTERAFVNNKIDLTQVEAVADIINATSINAAKSALLSLQGSFSKSIDELIENILLARASIEASINFPEDDSPDESTLIIGKKIDKIIKNVSEIILSVGKGISINQQPIITVIGKPNVGKSSLVNLLLGEEHSIVSDRPGTTRDAIKNNLVLDNANISIIDTAGIRSTTSEIESAGISMTRKAAQSSTLTLYLVDDNIGFDEEDRSIISRNNIDNFWIISNKIDLTSEQDASISTKENKTIRLSVLKNIGINLLREELSKALITNDQSVGTARARHLNHLNNALEHLYLSIKYNDNHDLELVAEELKISHAEMIRIKGGDINEDLLDKIFSDFCIGK